MKSENKQIFDKEIDINEVLKYFYEISKIPRMSGKEEKITDYIEEFAKVRNLEYIRDKYNNIIIFKESTRENKNDESVILQCHLDMVCEKEENSNHNFEKDGLEIYIEDDYIKAKNTTLGADNGIGIAIILAILSSSDVNHPKIEAIFTVEEETTMLGAQKIDVSMLSGKKMICLDNMSEEELWVGCAGAKIFEYEIKGDIKKINNDNILIKLGINGFMGGHSGKDIGKNRGNPIKEMGNLLYKLYNKYTICIKSIYGGRKVNVIPRQCYCEIYIKSTDFEAVLNEIKDYNKYLKEKIVENNENINVTIEKMKAIENDSYSFDLKLSKEIINILNQMKNGVYYEDKYKNPLVSLNIGKIESIKNKIKISFSIRTNREKIEKKLEEELNNNIIDKYDNIKVKKSELEGYEHKEKSDFVDKCKMIYNKYFNREPRVIDMHICLEAGFFGAKIKDLDFIAIAPNIYDAHSPKERCSLSSLKKIYNYIILILDELNKK